MFPENVYFTISFFVCILPATFNFNDFFLMNTKYIFLGNLWPVYFQPQIFTSTEIRINPFSENKLLTKIISLADDNFRG